MRRAGRKHDKFSFQKRVEQGNDGLGNVLSDWVEQFQQRCDYYPERGTESVLADRLEGIVTGSIVVYRNCKTEMICPDWRAVDVRGGTEYNIRAILPGQRRQEFKLTVQSGVAEG